MKGINAKADKMYKELITKFLDVLEVLKEAGTDFTLSILHI